MANPLIKFNFFNLRDVVKITPLKDDNTYPCVISIKSGLYKIAYSDNDISSIRDFMNETPFIPSIYDHIIYDNKHFYVTDYKDCLLYDLRTITLEEMTSEKYYCQLVENIEHLNRHGVYYDDLDCDNVLVDRFDRLHIIDVGGFTLLKEDQKPRMVIEMEGYDEVIPLPL